MLGQKPYGGLHLLFKVVAPVLDPAGGVELPLLLSFDGGPQAVPAFDVLQNRFRPGPVLTVRYDRPVIAQAYRNDMNVFAVDVAVFEYVVGLLAEAHALHVLAGDLRKLGIGQTVGNVGIQRYMEYGVFDLPGIEVGLKTQQGTPHIERVGLLAVA